MVVIQILYKTEITILLTKTNVTFLLRLNLVSSIATKALLPPIHISRLLSSLLTASPQISLKSVVTLVSDLLLPHGVCGSSKSLTRVTTLFIEILYHVHLSQEFNSHMQIHEMQ